MQGTHMKGEGFASSCHCSISGGLADKEETVSSLPAALALAGRQDEGQSWTDRQTPGEGNVVHLAWLASAEKLPGLSSERYHG